MDQILTQITAIWDDLEAWRGVILVFGVVFGVMLANFVLKRLLHRLLKATERTESLWDDAMLRAAFQPLRMLVWVLGLTLAADLVLEGDDSGLSGLVAAVRDLGVIVSLTWFLMGLGRTSGA